MKLTDELLEQHAAEARDLWLSTLPQQEEVPPHKFSRRFERKMRRLRAEQRRSPRMNRVVHILRYVAACAAVVLCIGGTAYAYRIGVIDTIIQVFREYTSITYSSETAAEDAEFPESTFGYIPEGMVRNEDECMNDEFMRITVYQNPNAESTFTIYEESIFSSGGSVSHIDTENAVTDRFSIHGEEAFSSVKDNTIIITWTNNDIAYTFVSYNLSLSDAKQIVLNIHQK